MTSVRRAGSRPGWLAGVALAMVSGCAAPPPATAPAGPAAAPAVAPPAPAEPAVPAAGAAPRYRCEGDLEFTVRFADDSATIDAGDRGREVLLRDAGGVTPRQSVYSNDRLRADFGLGADGRDATLRYADPPRVVHCMRG